MIIIKFSFTFPYGYTTIERSVGKVEFINFKKYFKIYEFFKF